MPERLATIFFWFSGRSDPERRVAMSRIVLQLAADVLHSVIGLSSFMSWF